MTSRDLAAVIEEMRRPRRGDPTLEMTPPPSVPALVRRGSLALATVGFIACGGDERTGTPPPPDGAVQTGGTGSGGLAPMAPFSGGRPGPGGAPMATPMPPMPYPGTGGSESGGSGPGGAPMTPPYSGGAPMPTGGTGGTPIIAPMPPPPPMPAPIPTSLPRKR